MFKKQQYDKATLTYLGEYFCGATRDMKRLWEVMREYEIPSYKVAERIITQMLFSENIFDEEKIFEDYYLSDTAYFRLKQAYLAFVSREYILYGRELETCVFHIIARECDQKEELPDVCKVALLCYYAGSDYPADIEAVLHQLLREMCEKQIIFPAYMKYKEEWLREVQLYDKTIVSYQAKEGSKVKLFYKIKGSGKKTLGYHSEMLVPVFENLYVKQFVLYADEELDYYIQESDGKESTNTEKQIIRNDHAILAGRFGRINAMVQMTPANRNKSMMEYEEEDILAKKMFKLYE